MKTLTQTIVSSLAVLVLGFAASPARADHDLDRLLERIDRMAHEIHEHADDLRHEVRHHLVGHPDYGHLISDVELLHRATVRVEQLVHQPHRLSELCRAAHQLDDRVHHLEDTLRGCESYVSRGHGGHGHGHIYHSVHRFHFSDSRRLVNAIESDTHQLMRDIERLERRVSTPVHTYGTYGRGVSVGPGAITVGGRGFSFSIGR